MPSPSKKKCMKKGCNKPPERECIWADGRGRAWFCDKHFKEWEKDPEAELPRDIVKQRQVEHGAVGDKYGEEPGKKASARRVVQAHVVIQKVAGWWAIDPEEGTGQIDWGNSGTPGGLANEIPGQTDDTKRYNGDGPADIMDAALADIDLAYRQSWGRPAFPEELAAVFDFCFGPLRRDGVDSSVWPENQWIDEAAAIAGVSPDVIVNLSERDLEDTERMFREMRNSGFGTGMVYEERPEPTPEAVGEWEAHVNAAVRFERERAQKVLGKAAHDGYPYKADQKVVVGPYVDDQNPETRFFKPGIVRGDPEARETLDDDVLVDIEDGGEEWADPDEIMAENEWAEAYPNMPFPKTRTENIPLEVSASRVASRFLLAQHESQTGDGSGVWTGFRVPEPYADQFPDLGDDDDSPPHITFLYIGDVNPARAEELAGIVSGVFSTAVRVRAQHTGLDYFEQPDRDGRVAVDRVRFSHDLAGYRDLLRSRLEDAGFEVADSFPVYQPHTTLEYLDGRDTEYREQVPKGSWAVPGLEVWGLPQMYAIPLGEGG